MVSLDRLPMSRFDSTVYCPLRSERVRVAQCAACDYAVHVDLVAQPRVVVCNVRYVLGALGLNVDP